MKQGVVLCSVRDVEIIPQVDLPLQITKTSPLPRWRYYSDLAPSKNLFGKYLVWLRKGEWPAKWPEYAEQFITEMRSSLFAEALDEVTHCLRAGKSVALACFCDEEIYCHRAILGGYFSRLGYPVENYQGGSIDELTAIRSVV